MSSHESSQRCTELPWPSPSTASLVVRHVDAMQDLPRLKWFAVNCNDYPFVIGGSNERSQGWMYFPILNEELFWNPKVLKSHRVDHQILSFFRCFWVVPPRIPTVAIVAIFVRLVWEGPLPTNIIILVGWRLLGILDYPRYLWIPGKPRKTLFLRQLDCWF